MCDDILIILEEDCVSYELSDELNIIDVKNIDHSKLNNLDYYSSGHTGFMPSDLSQLIVLDPAADRSIAQLVVDYAGNTNRVSPKDLFDKFIRLAYNKPNDLQSGDYFLLNMGYLDKALTNVAIQINKFQNGVLLKLYPESTASLIKFKDTTYQPIIGSGATTVEQAINGICNKISAIVNSLNKIGNLTDLQTQSKSSIVNAINEVNAKATNANTQVELVRGIAESASNAAVSALADAAMAQLTADKAADDAERALNDLTNKVDSHEEATVPYGETYTKHTGDIINETLYSEINRKLYTGTELQQQTSVKSEEGSIELLSESYYHVGNITTQKKITLSEDTGVTIENNYINTVDDSESTYSKVDLWYDGVTWNNHYLALKDEVVPKKANDQSAIILDNAGNTFDVYYGATRTDEGDIPNKVVSIGENINFTPVSGGTVTINGQPILQPSDITGKVDKQYASGYYTQTVYNDGRGLGLEYGNTSLSGYSSLAIKSKLANIQVKNNDNFYNDFRITPDYVQLSGGNSTNDRIRMRIDDASVLLIAEDLPYQPTEPTTYPGAKLVLDDYGAVLAAGTGSVEYVDGGWKYNSVVYDTGITLDRVNKTIKMVADDIIFNDESILTQALTEQEILDAIGE